MFGFFSKKDETKNLLHNQDPQAENILIHTMERDLESSDTAEKESAQEIVRENFQPASRITLGNLTNQQKTSPFLNKTTLSGPGAPATGKPTVEIVKKPLVNSFSPPSAPPAPRPQISASLRLPDNFSRPVSAPAPPKDFFPETKEIESAVTDQQPPNGENIKKLILIVLIILIVTTILAGAYYFWNTRKSTQQAAEPVAPETVIEETTENLPIEENTDNEEPAISKFSTSGPNYLEVNINDPSSEAMREALKSYVQEVRASGMSSSVEFKVVTPEKIPVLLPTFLEKMKITFSPELAASLADDFSIYIYNDSGGPGVGLAISLKKDAELGEVLLEEEKVFPDELKAFFPVEQYTLEKNKPFSTSEYTSVVWGKIEVRYLNIISPENLSVDYALVNVGAERLLIATTKETLRSIIEKQQPAILAP